MDIIHWSVRSSSRRGGDEVKGVEGENRFLALCDLPFIRENENLVWHENYQSKIDQRILTSNLRVHLNPNFRESGLQQTNNNKSLYCDYGL